MKSKGCLRILISSLLLISSVFFASCKTDILDQKENSVEYGSLVINDNRAIAIDELTEAFVTVSGYGMEDLTQTVAIKNGKGSFVFEKVRAGKNRIVTVKSNIDGILMRNIVDVEAAKVNSVTVNWDSTALGNVFYYLNKNKVDITKVDPATIKTAIPNVHACYVNAEQIANDYENLKASDSYVIAAGKVKVAATGCDGYKVQVTDPDSKVYTVSGSGSTFDAAPGDWKVIITDSTGEFNEKRDIKVESDKTTTVTLLLQSEQPTDSIELYVPVNNAQKYNTVWAWTDSTNYTGGNWPGQKMTTSGEYYRFTIKTTSCNVILNQGTNGGDQTSDLAISQPGNWLWNGSSFEQYNAGGSGTPSISVSQPQGGGGNDDPDPSVFKVYVSSNSNPKLWAWSNSAKNVTTANDWPGVTMTAATDMNDNSKWFVTTLSKEKLVAGEVVSFIVSEGSSQTGDITGRSKTFWYDGLGLWGDKVKGQVYDTDPTVPPTPVAPKVSVSSKAYLGETFEITVTSLVNLTSGSDTLTIGGKSTKVNIGKNTFNVADFTTTAKTLTVTGTLANEAGSTSVNASIEITEKPVLKLVTDPKELRIYQVMVSSFQDGDESRGFTCAYGPSNALKGGDLQGIINAADYIKDLGCNAIWMTPIFESNGGGELDSTGYFAYDYFNIDDQFGTNEKFAELVDVYHSKGMAVILDGVFGHNKGYVAASPNRKGIKYPGITPDTANPVNYATNGNSLKYYSDVASYWITEYKIDGWRFDQCYQLGGGEYNSGKNCNTGGMNYWYDIRKVIEAAAASNGTKGQDWGTLGYMVGEDWDGNQQSLQASVVSPRGSKGYGLNSCFDFPAYYYVVQGFAQEWDGKTTSNITSGLSYLYKTYQEKGYSCKDDDGSYDEYYPNFMLTNHDLYRIGDLIQKKFSCGYDNAQYVGRNKVLLAAQCAYSGPITIYYGDEIAAHSADNSNGGGWYPDNVARSSGKITNFNSWEQQVHDFTQKCLQARAEHPALWKGTNTQVVGQADFYVAKKVSGSETIYIAFNYSTSEKSFSASGTDLISGESFSGTVKVPALSARYILVK